MSPRANNLFQKFLPSRFLRQAANIGEGEGETSRRAIAAAAAGAHSLLNNASHASQLPEKTELAQWSRASWFQAKVPALLPPALG